MSKRTVLRTAFGLAVVGAAFAMLDCDSFESSSGSSADAGFAETGEPALPPDGDGAVDAAVPDVAERTCPPGMVGAGTFCIDRYEVSQSEYAAFHAVFLRDAAPPIPECATKDAASPGSRDLLNLPVTMVDWCDAAWFCASLGKRLCTQPEWSSACSGPAKTAFPYGNSFEAEACHTGAAGRDAAAPSSEFLGCQGGYPRLFDMSGNVDEWSATCPPNTTVPNSCHVLGGEFTDTVQKSFECENAPTRPRFERRRVTGIRCCAD